MDPGNLLVGCIAARALTVSAPTKPIAEPSWQFSPSPEPAAVPFYRPILLALAAAAVYAWDPQRLQLFQSLTGAVHTQRFIPLMPAGVIFWVAALQICSPALGDTTCSRVSPSSRSPTPATHALLVDPAETASICLYGHGQAVESRWRRSFQC
jgi:hypothetical protein